MDDIKIIEEPNLFRIVKFFINYTFLMQLESNEGKPENLFLIRTHTPMEGSKTKAQKAKVFKAIGGETEIREYLEAIRQPGRSNDHKEILINFMDKLGT